MQALPAHPTVRDGRYRGAVRRRRILYAAAILVLLVGVGVFVFALPTQWGCNSEDPAFTTSRSVAYATCVSGITGDPVADRRAASRATTIAVVVFVDAILLRWASVAPLEERPGGCAKRSGRYASGFVG